VYLKIFLFIFLYFCKGDSYPRLAHSASEDFHAVVSGEANNRFLLSSLMRATYPLGMNGFLTGFGWVDNRFSGMHLLTRDGNY